MCMDGWPGYGNGAGDEHRTHLLQVIVDLIFSKMRLRAMCLCISMTH